MKKRGFLASAIGGMVVMLPFAAQAANVGNDDYSSARLIVVYKADVSAARRHALSSNESGVAQSRVSATGAHILALPPGASAQDTRRLADWLRASPDVAAVEPDVIVHSKMAPSIGEPFAGPSYGGAQNFPNVLTLTHSRQLLGNLAPFPVAVVDSGITNHSALPNILPGYNFYQLLSGSRSSNYYDSGDWVSQAEAASPAYTALGCHAKDSDWHGTAIAGLIGALHNDTLRVEGVAAGAAILPARALGKCGGYMSDVMDAALWSAGIAVQGVPGNANPVRVVNLSVGAQGSCSAYFQNAIDLLVGQGVVAVAAAGNNNEDTTQVIPGGCNGVLTIAASDNSGGLASYSASGSNVAVAAPGGEFSLGIVTTSNTGRMGPEIETSGAYYGSSNSTAVVSGTVSLMLAANPALQPARVGSILKTTAQPMSTCPVNCGGGRLDADAAVKAAFEGVIYNNPGFPAVDLGANADSVLQVRNVSGLMVTFGAAVFGGTNPVDFTKTIDTCSGATLNDGDTCTLTIRFSPTGVGRREATIQIPSNMPAAGITARLFAVGNGAAMASATTPSPSAGVAPSASGGGGGCAIANAPSRPDPLWPLLTAMAASWLIRRRRRAAVPGV